MVQENCHNHGLKERWNSSKRILTFPRQPWKPTAMFLETWKALTKQLHLPTKMIDSLTSKGIILHFLRSQYTLHDTFKNPNASTFNKCRGHSTSTTNKVLGKPLKYPFSWQPEIRIFFTSWGWRLVVELPSFTAFTGFFAPSNRWLALGNSEPPAVDHRSLASFAMPNPLDSDGPVHSFHRSCWRWPSDAVAAPFADSQRVHPEFNIGSVYVCIYIYAYCLCVYIYIHTSYTQTMYTPLSLSKIREMQNMWWKM